MLSRVAQSLLDSGSSAIPTHPRQRSRAAAFVVGRHDAWNDSSLQASYGIRVSNSCGGFGGVADPPPPVHSQQEEKIHEHSRRKRQQQRQNQQIRR